MAIKDQMGDRNYIKSTLKEKEIPISPFEGSYPFKVRSSNGGLGVWGLCTIS